MAEPDAGIKKVIVKQGDLPAIKNTGEYLFRYRIKKKNNNQQTDWSNTYLVSLTNPIASILQSDSIAYSLASIDNNTKIQISWTMPDALDINYFDIYVKWYSSSTQPDLTTQNTTNWTIYPKVVYGAKAEIDVPSGSKWVQIAVTAESFPKFAGTNITNQTTFLFATPDGLNLRSLPITLDGGLIA